MPLGEGKGHVCGVIWGSFDVLFQQRDLLYVYVKIDRNTDMEIRALPTCTLSIDVSILFRGSFGAQKLRLNRRGEIVWATWAREYCTRSSFDFRGPIVSLGSFGSVFKIGFISQKPSLVDRSGWQFGSWRQLYTVYPVYQKNLNSEVSRCHSVYSETIACRVSLAQM